MNGYFPEQVSRAGNRCDPTHLAVFVRLGDTIHAVCRIDRADSPAGRVVEPGRFRNFLNRAERRARVSRIHAAVAADGYFGDTCRDRSAGVSKRLSREPCYATDRDDIAHA